MKIAVFGGVFDPPHLGHQRIAEEMIAHQLVDEVWFVPVYQHPWADRLQKFEMADYEHRKQMVKLILSPQTALKEYLDVGYAYKTLLYFAKKHPEHEFSWIIGADNLVDFKDWKYHQQVLTEFGVYVYPRKGFKLETNLTGMTLLKDFPEVVVSSTQIKNKIATGESIAGLVDERVEEYIENNQLYETNQN